MVVRSAEFALFLRCEKGGIWRVLEGLLACISGSRRALWGGGDGVVVVGRLLAVIIIPVLV